VFGPYHHLFFANGYVYTTAKYEPFLPTSAPEVALYLPEHADPNPNAAVLAGEIGAGARQGNSAYWFNAYGASFGCANRGPDDCLLRITAYAYDEQARAQVVAGQQYESIPPCPPLHGCPLTPIVFADTFEKLSGIRFEAFVTDRQVPFMLDSLALGWYDNTCAASDVRSSGRK
jgi:hypothetical protein